MHVATRMTGLLLIVLFLYHCTPVKENYYAYKTATYAIDTVKRALYYDNIISYGKYLFEFKTRISENLEVHPGSSKSISINFDTVGVYLLSGANKCFYEFDTFSLKSNLVKTGRLDKKPNGQTITISANDSSSDLSYTRPKKIMMNHIPCFVAELIPDNGTGDDSVIQKMILIKSRQFNSLYKTNGINFRDTNYCIVGIQVYDLTLKQGFSQELETIRFLTKEEKEICENMIRKSELGAIATTGAPFLSNSY
jgi:hypothetical protein